MIKVAVNGWNSAFMLTCVEDCKLMFFLYFPRIFPSTLKPVMGALAMQWCNQCIANNQIKVTLIGGLFSWSEWSLDYMSPWCSQYWGYKLFTHSKLRDPIYRKALLSHKSCISLYFFRCKWLIINVPFQMLNITYFCCTATRVTMTGHLPGMWSDRFCWMSSSTGCSARLILL